MPSERHACPWPRPEDVVRDGRRHDPAQGHAASFTQYSSGTRARSGQRSMPVAKNAGWPASPGARRRRCRRARRREPGRRPGRRVAAAPGGEQLLGDLMRDRPWPHPHAASDREAEAARRSRGSRSNGSACRSAARRTGVEEVAAQLRGRVDADPCGPPRGRPPRGQAVGEPRRGRRRRDSCAMRCTCERFVTGMIPGTTGLVQPRASSSSTRRRYGSASKKNWVMAKSARSSLASEVTAVARPGRASEGAARGGRRRRPRSRPRRARPRAARRRRCSRSDRASAASAGGSPPRARMFSMPASR